MVFQVKVLVNGTMSLALLGSTLEEVKLSVIFVSYLDLGLEESIDR